MTLRRAPQKSARKTRMTFASISATSLTVRFSRNCANIIGNIVPCICRSVSKPRYQTVSPTKRAKLNR